MSIKNAIDKAIKRAKHEALTNSYNDSMMFVVWDDNYNRYIVINEWHYDLAIGIGDIGQAVASIWSDGKVAEVEKYK